MSPVNDLKPCLVVRSRDVNSNSLLNVSPITVPILPHIPVTSTFNFFIDNPYLLHLYL